MQKFISPLAVAVFILSCSAPRETAGVNYITSDEKRIGWRLLFDGKTTSGWHKYGNKPVGSAWKIKEDYLYLDTTNKDGGDIVTNEEYENFHLQLEWRIAADGNSGIFFYINEDKTKYNWPWETGPEMQVLDNNGHPDGKIKTHHAGDLFDIIASSKEAVRPAGEWNLAEIKCINGKLDFYLNGENIVSTNMWDDKWKKMVANSKFRNMPGFSAYRKGRIGLQDHGNEVCFRNIKIRRL